MRDLTTTSRNDFHHDAKIKVLITVQLLLHHYFLIQDQCFAKYFSMIS